MATITAPGEGASGTPAQRVDPPVRPLWQAPIFVLGVAALVGMAVGRPFAPIGPAQRIARDLSRARALLSRPDGDADEALKLALTALSPVNAERFADHVPEAALLAGWAEIRLAEKGPASRAAEAWRQAHQYLGQAQQEQAERDTLSTEDQALLAYRLGKVGFYTGNDLNQVIARLEEATPRGDSRAEGYGLLAAAYLRLNPPNLQKALECNRKLRDEADDATESQLTAAQLLGGELLLRLGKPEESRRSLKMITEQAPPEILVRARLLRARCYQDEKNWSDAARLYQTVLGDNKAQVPDPARVYYDLGWCYRELDERKSAANAWQECVKLATGEEGPAAALVLAELHLLDNAHERALESLTTAVARVHSPSDWHNPLLGRGKAIKSFERASEAFRKAGRYELASKLIEPYCRLATPLKVLIMRGDTASEWAESKRSDGRKPDVSPELENEALALFVQAAEAYGEASADPTLKPAEQGKYVWASALAYQSAKDPVKVMERLEKFVKLNVEPAKLGEAYYRLGDVFLQGNDNVSATKNYRLCIREGETHFAHLARYQLAMIALKEGRVDEALGMLSINIKNVRYEDDPEALAQSLFALADLWYQRSDHHAVCRTLEVALGRFKENPKFKDNPEVTRARFQLADSYRQIALRESDLILTESMDPDSRATFMAEHRRLLRQAAEEFASLDAYLASEAGKEQLTAKQRADVPAITAKCWFQLGEYDKALAINERLIAQFPDQLQGLDALGRAVECHAKKGQIDMIRQRLIQIRQLLPKLPDEVRKAWEPWWEACVKELKDLPQTAER